MSKLQRKTLKTDSCRHCRLWLCFTCVTWYGFELTELWLTKRNVI